MNVTKKSNPSLKDGSKSTGRGRKFDKKQHQKVESNLIEKVVAIQRNSRVVKGGKIKSFAVIVVVGDGQGSIGYAREKALNVNDAMNKALIKARKDLVKIELGKETLLYPLNIEYKASKIFLQQASPGTGIVANHSLRCIFEALGVKNVLSKVHGSRTAYNLVEGVIGSLKKVKSIKHFARKRGLTYQQMFFAQGANQEGEST